MIVLLLRFADNVSIKQRSQRQRAGRQHRCRSPQLGPSGRQLGRDPSADARARSPSRILNRKRAQFQPLQRHGSGPAGRGQSWTAAAARGQTYSYVTARRAAAATLLGTGAGVRPDPCCSCQRYRVDRRPYRERGARRHRQKFAENTVARQLQRSFIFRRRIVTGWVQMFRDWVS